MLRPQSQSYGDLRHLPSAFPESTYSLVGVELEMPILPRRSQRPLPLFDAAWANLPQHLQERVDGEFLKCQIEMKSSP